MRRPGLPSLIGCLLLGVLSLTPTSQQAPSLATDSTEDFLSSRWARELIRQTRAREGGNGGGKNIWAVLVAGSNGWWNYRHQADICHAYHILISHGVPANQIITMMYDDIANNKANPYRGKIFNSPAKKDVYAGVKIDYTGQSVNPKNFMAVITGDRASAHGGNGRVLESGADDHVFIYFADHGATGILAFPNGELTVKELSTSLKKMHTKELYGQVTFYVEACESGSMFEHTLTNDLNIYTVTAANGEESSYATYCNLPQLNLPCLGDEFSVNWLEDSDKENLNTETLLRQFQIVKGETKMSHVCSFGENVTIPTEYVSSFQGDQESANAVGAVDRASFGPYEMWSSREVPLRELYARQHKLLGESGDGSVEATEEYTSVTHEIHVMKKKRRYLEAEMVKLVNTAVHDPVNRQRVLSTYPASMRNLDCHHRLVKVFSRVCFSFSKNPYALKYAYVLTNLCEMGIDQQRLVNILVEQCAELDDIQFVN